MYLLYDALLLVYVLFRLPSIAWAVWRHGKALGDLGERCGRLPPAVNPERRPSIWVHAVSVGETLAARPLLAALRDAYPGHRRLLSTTTATGQQVARGLGDLVDATFYAPFDLPPFVARTLDRAAPDLLIVVDTEIWPNLLRACRRRGVRTVLANGRLTARSFRGYRRAGRFMRRVVGDFDRICVQTAQWGRWFEVLGADAARVSVTGSLKFDARSAAAGEARHPVLACLPAPPGRPVVVAASTLRGEEEPVLRAFARARERNRGALLVLAPRHPERFEEAVRIAVAAGYRVARRTALSEGAGGEVDVVVLDTIGELPYVYEAASCVFVGGSLVPAGGHNILEPAAVGKAILFGPHMESFAEIARLFVARDAAVQVPSAVDLESEVAALLEDPERCRRLGAAARAVLDAYRGATSRTLTAIAELLPPAARAGAASRAGP